MFLAGEAGSRLRWLARSSILRFMLFLSGVFALGMVSAIILALLFGRDAVLRRADTSLLGLAVALAQEERPQEFAAVVIRPLQDLGDAPSQFGRVARNGGGTVELDEDYRQADEWRVMLARDADNQDIVLALPLDDSEDAVELLAGALWTTAGLVLVIVLGAGLFVGVLAQRRLTRIVSTLERLAQGDLEARTGLAPTQDDLGELASQLDKTAGDLEGLVAQTRNLSASLAHDLRTPLARLQAKLEKLPEGEARGAALEEAGRLSTIFDTIMRVARIEAAHGRDGFERVDLTELVADVADIFGPVVEDADKVLRVETEKPATIEADRAMLVQALANLIQNAIVHGGDQLVLFARGGEIAVSDNGAGIDPNQYGEVVKPMVRLDAARNTEGSGLGLALVRAVADRHRAKLTLAAVEPSGLRVSMKFTEV